MRIAFVTRQWSNPKNPEKGLHGTNAVLAGLRACGLDVTHEEVPDTYREPFELCAPELRDFIATRHVAMCKPQWFAYDLVLVNDPGLFPAFALTGVPFIGLVHLEWWRQNHAVVLENCMRFARHVIVPKASMIGRAESLVKKVHWMPWPVARWTNLYPQLDMVASVQSAYDLVWVGRDDAAKNPSLALAICQGVLERGGRAAMWWSYMPEQRARWIEGRCPQLEVHVGEHVPDDLYSRTKSVLSTSSSESFGYTLVEGLMAGALPVVPVEQQVDHLYPFALRIDTQNRLDLGQARHWAEHVLEAIRDDNIGLRAVRREWALRAFAADGPNGAQWRAYLERACTVRS